MNLYLIKLKIELIKLTLKDMIDTKPFYIYMNNIDIQINQLYVYKHYTYSQIDSILSHIGLDYDINNITITYF